MTAPEQRERARVEIAGSLEYFFPMAEAKYIATQMVMAIDSEADPASQERAVRESLQPYSTAVTTRVMKRLEDKIYEAWRKAAE